MKVDNTTLMLAAVVAFMLFRRPSIPPGTTTGVFPPEPANDKSGEWVKWVQIVIAIAGGLIPALFGEGGPFHKKPTKTISAAAFWNTNLNATPNAGLPGYDYRNPGWGMTSPWLNSNRAPGTGVPGSYYFNPLTGPNIPTIP